MSAVLIRQSRNARARRKAAASRLVAAGLAAIALAGMIVVAPAAPVAPANAEASGSELTVQWNSDSGSAKDFQPQRNADSPHFNDFKDIQISVSQTTGIIDQAVRVSVTGFSGTISSYQSALPLDNAKNYLQAMQCWGPNPLAEDFRETCQWGGRYKEEFSSLGNSVYSDNAARTGPLDFDLSKPTDHDVIFRTAGGTKVPGKSILDKGVEKYPVRDYFSASTTNEVISARVSADGTGYFDFETQSSDQAPQLGCGSEGKTRCWLVVVPRGTHFGGDGEQCSGIRDPSNDDKLYTYGQRNAIQGGSPINDKCDYWDNRIVVPLDFAPTGATCKVGSVETRVVGSQLMIGAMSSWQPALCNTLDTTYSFASNPDSVARAQLIETGSSTPGMAYTGFPVSSGELLTEYERELLTKTKLTYAPVAISAGVVAFFAESPSGRVEKLVLSPRLVAKLLTQSYPFTVPQSQGDPSKNAVHLGAVNRTYTTFSKDPEFRALNPNFAQFPYNPSIVLPGPSGADAIRQVWRWIFADKDAAAFMNGTADADGMTVNPYYLPKGHPLATVPWYLDDAGNYVEVSTPRAVGLTNLDGTPQKLTDRPLDSFPKNDETLMPLQLVNQRSRFDSIQFAPYSETFLDAARRTFRADAGAKTTWNPDVITSDPNIKGDWVSGSAQIPGQRFMIAITDTVSANRWGLSAATIMGANSTTPVDATDATMSKALEALEPTSLDLVKQVNPASVAADGYPLTIVTYAGVNLTKSTGESRTKISGMLALVVTAGQIRGTAIGQLPRGYIPLTQALSEQASQSILEIFRYVAPNEASTPRPSNSSYAQDDFTGAALDGEFSAGSDPSVTTGMDDLSSSRTQVSSASPLERSGLVIALVLGLAGLFIAPTLFRGRGLR